jgi:uncharacterized protein (AIM24 family)
MERRAHELDHRIVGDDMQCVEITLDPNETVIAEAGTLMMMDDGIAMATIFGDGNGQKDSFLCAAKGVSIGIAFQKRLGAGLFGGEGFIMQKLEGDGQVYIHAGGTTVQRELAPGETLRVDTGCLVAMTQSVDYDIQFVGGIKNTLFGGEGLFFAHLRGPGHVWIQSLPFSRLADNIIAAAPKAGGRGREEGSILGGLGRMLDGDN